MSSTKPAAANGEFASDIVEAREQSEASCSRPRIAREAGTARDRLMSR